MNPALKTLLVGSLVSWMVFCGFVAAPYWQHSIGSFIGYWWFYLTLPVDFTISIVKAVIGS